MTGPTTRRVPAVWLCTYLFSMTSLQWCHNESVGVSNQRLDCLHKHLFKRKSKKTLKLRVTGLCEGNPPVTGGFPSQRACNAENDSIWWRHHAIVAQWHHCASQTPIFIIIYSSKCLLTDDTKLLHKPMMNNCQLDPQQKQITEISMKLKSIHVKIMHLKLAKLPNGHITQ